MCTWNPTSTSDMVDKEPEIKPPKSRPVCLTSETRRADIDMEAVLDVASVGYPTLVLSVTGWHEVVMVDSWSVKPLHVIVVPFSHQDPGWTDTMDGYFSTYTKETLNQIVLQLSTNPSWKFVWSEIVLLQKWWMNTNNFTRTAFKRLLANGQLELLTGGWVMPDQATTHYAAMLDQLIEGQRWVKDNLNYTIRTSWSTDQFGHSSTWSYLIGNSGIQNLVITRSHYAVRRHLSKRKQLEFHWSTGHDDDKSLFCHMTPFLLYGIPHSCGPDRHVCCKFDFSKKSCFQGQQRLEPVSVTDHSVEQLSTEFWTQLQKKSELYRSNVLLVPHGDDFRFKSVDEWNNQFGNLEKIFKFINSSENMNTKIQFGTMSDYFKSLQSDRRGPRFEHYPTLTGDLLTYSDRSDQYWAGFFTSRPFYKHLARKLQAVLRSAEVYFTQAVPLLGRRSNMTSLYHKLEAARRGLALFQHHDAITGTSLPHVMVDFGKKLHQSVKDAKHVEKRSLETVLQIYRPKAETTSASLEATEWYPSYDRLPRKVVLTRQKTSNVTNSLPTNGRFQNIRTLVVANSLIQHRHDIIHVHVSSTDVIVTDVSGSPVRFQVGPVWRDNTTISENEFKLSIEVEVPPLSVSRYIIHFGHSSPTFWNKSSIAVVTEFATKENTQSKIRHNQQFNVKMVREPRFVASNEYFSATFSSCDGMLKSVRDHDNGIDQRVDSHFVTYSTGSRSHPLRDKSGAYIFLPDGPAKDLNGGNPFITVTHGDLLTEIRTVYPDIVHVASIYNVNGPVGRGVFIDNVVDMSNSRWDNVELVLRFETDVIASEHTFCVDVNGLKMARRKTRAKMSLQGNFHPVTQMAYLENTGSRFTVLTTGSHGAASLVSGWLELVLDRRLLQDDWRGLNKGLLDNVPTHSTFFVMLEQKLSMQLSVPVGDTCLPTSVSEVLVTGLNNPLGVYEETEFIRGHNHGLPTRSLPCGFHVVNARVGETLNNVLITIIKTHPDCNYEEIDTCRREEFLRLNELVNYGINISSCKETVLTGVTDLRNLSLQQPVIFKPFELKSFECDLA